MAPPFFDFRQVPYLKAQPLFTPSLRNTVAAGQKPVIEDWIRFTPMNTVNHMKSGETSAVSTTLNRTMKPANIITLRSSVMSFFLVRGRLTMRLRYP